MTFRTQLSLGYLELKLGFSLLGYLSKFFFLTSLYSKSFMVGILMVLISLVSLLGGSMPNKDVPLRRSNTQLLATFFTTNREVEFPEKDISRDELAQLVLQTRTLLKRQPTNRQFYYLLSNLLYSAGYKAEGCQLLNHPLASTFAENPVENNSPYTICH